MSVLAAVLALVLAAIAALHLYWGSGGVWPGRDEADCARRVVGFRGVRSMPGLAPSFGVAGALAVAALVSLALAEIVATPLPGWVVALAGIGMALVFLGRGIAGFTPAWRRLTPTEPFASLDVRYYAPLCMVIGIGFAILVAWGLSA